MKDVKLSVDLGGVGTALVYRSQKGEFYVTEPERGQGFSLPAWPGAGAGAAELSSWLTGLLQSLKSCYGMTTSTVVDVVLAVPSGVTAAQAEQLVAVAQAVFVAPVRVIPEEPLPLAGWRELCLQDIRVALARGKALISTPVGGEYVLRGTQVLPVLPGAVAATAELAAAGVEPVGYSAALVQAVEQGEAHRVQLLLAAGADAHAVDAEGRTLLHLAVAANAVECLRALLAVNEEAVNAQDSSLNTPLHVAARLKLRGCESMLLNVRGVDIRLKNKEGMTPLALTRYREQMLPSPWLDVNTGYSYGQSLLHMCVEFRLPGVLTLLLKVPGIDVNKRDDDGYTPLHYAASSRFSCYTEELLATPGVDLTAVTSRGDSVFSLAERYGSERVAELLQEAAQKR